jgi:hypothetical protein
LHAADADDSLIELNISLWPVLLLGPPMFSGHPYIPESGKEEKRVQKDIRKKMKRRKIKKSPGCEGVNLTLTPHTRKLLVYQPRLYL